MFKFSKDIGKNWFTNSVVDEWKRRVRRRGRVRDKVTSEYWGQGTKRE